MRENPFEVLYVSEVLQPNEFVRLFSPSLVGQMLPLFQPGNVVLKGTVGSGKSMLLDLLRPEIRLAYSSAQQPFPVPPRFAHFLGAGINFKHLRIDEFGLVSQESVRTRDELPLLIVDYLNWAIVRDVLQSVDLLRVARQIDVRQSLLEKHSQKRLDDFARKLAADDSWFGALGEVRGFDDLKRKLDDRLRSYRRYANLMADLPDAVHRERTSAGQPVEATARLLRSCQILQEGTHVFVRLDQYETLLDLNRVASAEASLAIRREINRFLDLRTPEVHFRVGVRRYAWDEIQDFGAENARLEKERAYREINLDRLLRKPENGPDGFKLFAEDVVTRRLTYARVNVPSDRQSVLKALFGATEDAATTARNYSRSASNHVRAIPVAKLSTQWQQFVTSLAQTNPLEAQLAAAWALQNPRLRSVPTPTSGSSPRMPWDREYWKKERRHQALLQIAAGHRQRLTWSGAEDIRRLSGENILVLVSLCRFTWSAWERSLNAEARIEHGIRTDLQAIPVSAQRLGLEEASRYWFSKVREQPGGDTRQAFITVVARHLREKLIADPSMTYPGHNGFSVEQAELRRVPEVYRLLKDAVDAGDLLDGDHTTKERSKLPRTKFYFQPILGPHFQLPVVRTKEPYYVTADRVSTWIQESRGLLGGDRADFAHANRRSPELDDQPNLFAI